MLKKKQENTQIKKIKNDSKMEKETYFRSSYVNSGRI